MELQASELILNPDGSIYHLNLLPEDIADTIILVGDPDRVEQVSLFFDSIEVKKQKREFVTHTGSMNGKRLTVISTGIGTDNIDIVLNELDALVNIDLENRTVKKEFTQLNLIRIGTSGALQQEIEVDSFLISTYAIGLDSLLHFYKSDHVQHKALQEAVMQHTQWSRNKSKPYVVGCNEELASKFISEDTHLGITVTNVGFYGPQGRQLRLNPDAIDLNDKFASFRHEEGKITNLEMETAGIYGMAKLLGHKAVSMNCIIANRALRQFSEHPKEAITSLISYTLNRITK